MVKEEYKQNIYKKFRYKRKTLKLFLKQIELFEETEKNLKLPTHTYKIGDDVFLKKGTFMHGTRNNIDSLPLIMENGFLSNNVFNPNTRAQKTPYAVSMWNIQEDILLKDYIYLYSGMTIRYTDNKDQPTTKLVPYQQLDQEIENSKKENYWMWTAEQTKEIRFLPSLIRDDVQLAFILNMDNSYVQKLIKQDIFNLNMDKKVVKTFISKWFIDNFIYAKRDDFTTNRESAIVFGLPSNLIEGVLVGKQYEKDEKILDKIKKFLPKAYICNLEGKVIKI